MQPGERVSLIQSIYATLSQNDMSWEMIGVMLDEFGAEYNADSEAPGALQRVRSLPDDKLSALHDYLHPEEGAAAPLPGADGQGPWQPDHFRLFISHTSAHKEQAGRIRSWMARYGVDGFVAHTTIDPTSEWVDVIQLALRTCHAMVAMLTEDFATSGWCDQEVGFCVGRGILIVPVRMGLDPYGFIGRYQGFTPNRNLYDLPSGAFDLLARHPLTAGRMVDPVVRRFTQSGTFDATRAAWPSLVALPREAWTPERLNAVRSALEDNSQLQHANLDDGNRTPVPEALEKHLRGMGIGTDDDAPF